MFKKTISLVLAAVIFSTGVTGFIQPLGSPHTVEAATSDPTPCTTYMDRIERKRNYIKNELIPTYDSLMRDSVRFQEYKQQYLDLAANNLGYIVNYFESINSDIADLATCNGIENLTEAEILALLQGVYAVLTSAVLSQTFSDSVDALNLPLSMLKYHKQVLSFLHTVNQFGKKIDNNDLLNKLVAGQPGGLGSAYASIKSVIQSQFDTMIDLVTYRQDSLDNSTSNTVTAVLWADRLNMIYEQLSEFPKESKINKLDKNPIIGHGVSVTKSNFLDSIKRGLITEGLMAVFSQHVPATDSAFLKDFAGNFAAITTAGGRLGLAITLAELNADALDNVVQGVAPAFDAGDKAYQEYLALREKQNTEFANEIIDAVTSVVEAKFNPRYTDHDYTIFFADTIEKLEKRTKQIYQLDPSEIKIYLDGRKLESTVPAYIDNGTTMVPLRLISEALGVDPKWDPAAQTITITTTRTAHWRGREVDIVLTVGSKNVKLHTMNTGIDVAPVIKDGTTFVPLRFITESLSLNVTWVPESNSILLTNRK